MELYFLGTGAGLPSTRRNVTSIALRWNESRGFVWLFDCGEGTQQQMLRAPFGPSKVESIFVTHLHGDHIYGLPGLLGSRAFQSTVNPVSIYGPPGLAEFVETAIRISETHLPYPMHFHEVTGPATIFEDQQVVVTCTELRHGVRSFGYRIEEKPTPGALQIEVLRDLDVPPGPLYGQLKAGRDVSLPDGRVIRSADVVGRPRKGRSVVILGDTLPCESATRLARDADVLVHEATYAAAEQERAQRYRHSSAIDAVNIAKSANVGHLILTHISARYDDEGESRLLKDATAIFPNTSLARDHFRFSVNRP